MTSVPELSLNVPEGKRVARINSPYWEICWRNGSPDLESRNPVDVKNATNPPFLTNFIAFIKKKLWIFWGSIPNSRSQSLTAPKGTFPIARSKESSSTVKVSKPWFRMITLGCNNSATLAEIGSSSTPTKLELLYIPFGQ